MVTDQYYQNNWFLLLELLLELCYSSGLLFTRCSVQDVVFTLEYLFRNVTVFAVRVYLPVYVLDWLNWLYLLFILNAIRAL